MDWVSQRVQALSEARLNPESPDDFRAALRYAPRSMIGNRDYFTWFWAVGQVFRPTTIHWPRATPELVALLHGTGAHPTPKPVTVCITGAADLVHPEGATDPQHWYLLPELAHVRFDPGSVRPADVAFCPSDPGEEESQLLDAAAHCRGNGVVLVAKYNASSAVRKCVTEGDLAYKITLDARDGLLLGIR